MLLMLLKRSKKIKSKVNKDQKSLLLFWIVIPISISLGFRFANYQSWERIQVIIAIIGIVVFLLGEIIRWLSITQLAEAFTVNVTITKNHQLKTTGLYSIVRHPSYFGLLLVVLGLSIAMNSLYSIFLVCIPIFLVLAYRIKIEEIALIDEFKLTYKEYTKNTKRILPYIY
jgi:protein-S-isoprenylcysteine O-methyltransferase Ste14